MADDIIKNVNPNIGVYDNSDPLGTHSVATKDFNSDAMLVAIQAMVASGLARQGTVTDVPNVTTFRVAGFIGLGSTFFRDWTIFVLWKLGGLGAAPQGEYQIASAFNSADGTITHPAFTATLVVGDKVMLLHPAIASIPGLITELAKVPKSDAAVIWNATAAAQITTQANLALTNNNLDHVSAVTDGANNYPNTVVAGSVLAKLISKVAAGATPSGFDNTTDSLEALADAVAVLRAQYTGLRVTKTSTSHLTSGTLFNFAGTIGIVSITGRVTTACEAAANTCKLSIVSDALAAYDICAVKDLTGLGIGTLLSITGTAADALIGTTVVGSIAPGQASMVVTTCITSGTITVTFSDSGNRDGVIVWEVLWIPLNAAGSVTAA
jgi:hypothetical protein